MADTDLARQRAETIKERMTADMRMTLDGNLGYDPRIHEGLLIELVDDGMHQVEQLLTEVTW